MLPRGLLSAFFYGAVSCVAVRASSSLVLRALTSFNPPIFTSCCLSHTVHISSKLSSRPTLSPSDLCRLLFKSLWWPIPQRPPTHSRSSSSKLLRAHVYSRHLPLSEYAITPLGCLADSCSACVSLHSCFFRMWSLGCCLCACCMCLCAFYPRCMHPFVFSCAQREDLFIPDIAISSVSPATTLSRGSQHCGPSYLNCYFFVVASLLCRFAHHRTALHLHPHYCSSIRSVNRHYRHDGRHDNHCMG
jgi:hypothetical protein